MAENTERNTVKIAHLSDLHLGYRAYRGVDSTGVNLREMDGYNSFTAVVDDVIDHDVSAVVVAGDVFHEPQPTVRAVCMAQEQFRRLAHAGIPVYAITGNHDTNDIVADMSAAQVLNDVDRNIFSHAEPYVVHEMFPDVYLHMISHHMYSQQYRTMSQVSPVEGAVNILTTHGSIIDPILDMKISAQESPREIVIPDHLWNDMSWDYMMLGHIHERGFIGSDDPTVENSEYKMLYNGSLIRRGFSDAECELGRGWTLWTVDSSGLFTPEFRTVTQRPQYDLETLDASDMTSQEISDAVVERVSAIEQEVGDTLDTKPIVRQKIANISVAKNAALDVKNIELHTKNFLSWTMPRTYVSHSATKKSDTTSTPAVSSDPCVSYTKWVSSYEPLKDADTSFANNVVKRSKSFLKTGQEAVWEDGN